MCWQTIINKYIEDNAKLITVNGFVKVINYQLQKPTIINF